MPPEKGFLRIFTATSLSPYGEVLLCVVDVTVAICSVKCFLIFMLFNFHNQPAREAECGSSGNSLGRQGLSPAAPEIGMPHCPSLPSSSLDKTRAACRYHSRFLFRCSQCLSGLEWHLAMGWAFLATPHSPPGPCSERQTWARLELLENPVAHRSEHCPKKKLRDNEWPWDLKLSNVLWLFSSYSFALPPISLHHAPSLSPQQRGCRFSLFMGITRELSCPWRRASTFLCTIIWTLTTKPLKIAAAATGYSPPRCNLKRLTVQFLKYLSHIDEVYNDFSLYVL